MPTLLEAGPERDLYDDFERVRSAVRARRIARRSKRSRRLRPSVDLFFDKVLVNAPDQNVRAQSADACLHDLLTEFSTIADFSEIVTVRRDKI